MKPLHFFTFFSIFFFLFCCSQSDPSNDQPKGSEYTYDYLFINGTIVDGLGNPSFQAEVAVKNDRIVKISKSSIPRESAQEVIDIEGLVLAPGFIDNHAHIQTSIHEHPLAENFTRQGITTIMASLHSGNQPWPLDAYASSLEVAPNVGFFAGHTWTRKTVIGMDNRPPTPEELDSMRYYVEETMKQGALGLSTGLLYVPANFAETEEIIELAKVAAKYGGIYVTHMRNEATGLLNSIRETIRIAE